MKYKSVIVTRRGGPDVMQVVENDLRAPAAGEVRVKILASCVCAPDVQARYGQSPFKPKYRLRRAMPSSASWMPWAKAWPRLGWASEWVGTL